MMNRKFNYTGACVPEKHYMVNIDERVAKIIALVDEGEYFSIDRPRQCGKTTTLDMLERKLSVEEYLVISLSFEGIGDAVFSSEERFVKKFLKLMEKEINLKDKKTASYLKQSPPDVSDLEELSGVISGIVEHSGKKIVLTIDEVDKSSNNQLFLSFLGMLRHKYLQRNKGKDYTFQSVILAGVHDVKNLKLKIRSGDEPKYNSPWNIAVDFDLDMCFAPDEIAGMLEDYKKEKKITLDVNAAAGKLHYLTSGHPFLVSKLCRIIDDKLSWEEGNLEIALNLLLKEKNTNFDSVVKNLENNPELYDLVLKIIMNEMEFSFNLHNPVIQEGKLYGILKEKQGKTVIHNRVYEQLLYNYMASKLETSGKIGIYVGTNYIDEQGDLNVEAVIRKFQQFMKEQYSSKDTSFIERNGRLLFLAFLKPIINNRGFDFKEVEVSEEKRLDIVITFGSMKYIVELKVWQGEKYHQKGIEQLCSYLDRQNETRGYLLIFDFRKKSGQAGQCRTIHPRGKTIFSAWV